MCVINPDWSCFGTPDSLEEHVGNGFQFRGVGFYIRETETDLVVARGNRYCLYHWDAPYADLVFAQLDNMPVHLDTACPVIDLSRLDGPYWKVRVDGMWVTGHDPWLRLAPDAHAAKPCTLTDICNIVASRPVWSLSVDGTVIYKNATADRVRRILASSY